MNIIRGLTIVILCVATTPVFAQDFRQSYWGATPDQVRMTEKGYIGSNDGGNGYFGLFCNGSLFGIKSTVIYFFSNNQLTVGTYIVGTEEDRDRNFELVFAKFQSMFGPPSKYHPEMGGCEWSMPNGNLVVILRYDNFCRVIFTNPSYNKSNTYGRIFN